MNQGKQRQAGKPDLQFRPKTGHSFDGTTMTLVMRARTGSGTLTPVMRAFVDSGSGVLTWVILARSGAGIVGAVSCSGRASSSLPGSRVSSTFGPIGIRRGGRGNSVMESFLRTSKTI